jgi:hypothetical protein
MRSRIAGWILRSAISEVSNHAAASVSMPSGRGRPPSARDAGPAWKQMASCWWTMPPGSTRTWVGSL